MIVYSVILLSRMDIIEKSDRLYLNNESHVPQTKHRSNDAALTRYKVVTDKLKW